jgi:hypothetical protein
MLAADHHVAEPEIFGEAAVTAAKAAEQDLIVTFGVQPTSPATGFGYIQPGAPLLDGSVSKVAAFVEKPDQATAERYVLEGYLWNSGNFAFKASTLLAEFEAFEPSVAAAAKACVALLELEAGLGRLDRETFARQEDLARLRGDGTHHEGRRRAGRLRLVGPGRVGRDLGSLGSRRGRQRPGRRRRPARRHECPGAHHRPVCRRDRRQRHRRRGRAGRRAGLPSQGQPGGQDPGRRPESQGSFDRLAQERSTKRNRDPGHDRRLRRRVAPRSGRRDLRLARLDRAIAGRRAGDGRRRLRRRRADPAGRAAVSARAIGAATLLVTKPR